MFQRISLATVLALLVLATTVPLVLFAGGLIWNGWRQQRKLVDIQNIDTARAISVGIDQEVRVTIAALSVLSSVDELDVSDLRPFYDLARRSIVLHAGWETVLLTDAAGRVLVNTDVAYGAPSSLVDRDWLATVVGMRAPVVSGIRRHPATQQFFVPIAVPVMRQGAVKYVLAARVYASVFGDALRRQSTPPGGVVTLIDANRLIIARTRSEDRYVGQAPAASFAEQSRKMSEGSWRSRLLEGTETYSALSRSALTGWTVGIGLPVDVVDGTARRSLVSLSTVGLVILGAGVGLALVLTRGVVRGQTAAADAARALAEGGRVSLPHSRIAQIQNLSQALRDAAATLDARERERDRALAAERETRATGEKNEARLAVTLRSIGDAVITTSAEGHVTMVNAVAQSLTGWSEQEAIGLPIERVFPTIHEQTREPVASAMARLGQEDGPAAAPAQALLVRKDGREIPVADSVAPIAAADGTLLGAVVVFRDVSAQREAERQRAAVLAREQAARRAAESLNHAKDEFLATISHELRTPLNAIFGWLAMLQTGTLDEAKTKRALAVIQRNTMVQTQLIEDLLDMSRAIRGTVRLDLQPVDLAVILEAAVESLRPTSQARGITVTVNAPRGVARVSADEGRMQQILWNLLSNSLKFTPTGGQITAEVTTERAQAIVRVTDTGEGIAPEFLSQVFDRFRQEVSDVRRTHSGLGIGLSIVRHLAELHGGAITAHSEGKGRGATFTVILPLLGQATPAAGAGATSPAMQLIAGEQLLRGLHVLVVDDDQDAQELVGLALRQAGAETTIAGSVREAFDHIATKPPDLVVSDIAMADESGFDLVRRLRATPKTAGLPAVAITAFSRSEDRGRAIAAGFDAHVGKPFEPRSLIGLLAGLTGRV